MPSRRSNQKLSEELPALLANAELSVRGLAEKVGVNPSHLSRALRGTDSKTISGELAGQIAVALSLPRDYFPEYREAVVLDKVRNDPELRDRLYGRLRKSATQREG